MSVEYPYSCRQCGHTFTKEKFAERHEVEFHGLEPREDTLVGPNDG